MRSIIDMRFVLVTFLLSSTMLAGLGYAQSATPPSDGTCPTALDPFELTKQGLIDGQTRKPIAHASCNTYLVAYREGLGQALSRKGRDNITPSGAPGGPATLTGALNGLTETFNQITNELQSRGALSEPTAGGIRQGSIAPTPGNAKGVNRDAQGVGNGPGQRNLGSGGGDWGGGSDLAAARSADQSNVSRRNEDNKDRARAATRSADQSNISRHNEDNKDRARAAARSADQSNVSRHNEDNKDRARAAARSADQSNVSRRNEDNKDRARGESRRSKSGK